MSESRTAVWLRRILPALILLLGVAGTVGLVRMKKPPKRKKHTEAGILVETLTVKRVKRTARVRSHGTVKPARVATIAPEVSAKVTWVNPALKIGGMLRKNAVLLRLSAVDFRLAMQKAKAQVAQAKKELAEAESNANVARREWKVLGRTASKGGTRQANPLTLKEPQLRLAKANVASARANLEQAKVNIARTTIRAPFDLRVRKEDVEKGQYVRVGQTLATVYATDKVEVVVPTPISELRWIDVPKRVGGTRVRHDDKAKSSTVWVRMKVDGQTYQRRGLLERTIGEIDADGRMTKVVVSIEDPYNLKRHDGDSYMPDFEVGAFVEVVIEGRELDHVIPIPASALRVGQVVWTVGDGDRLKVNHVKVARLTKKEALIESGIEPGDRVVLTPIEGAVDGMHLKLSKPTKAAAKGKLSAEARRATPEGQKAQ